MSNPEALAAQAAHQALIEELDIHSIHKSFRNPHWRPNQRRNKNVKAILGDASRKEASAMATPRGDSGTATPAVPSASGTPNLQPNLAQASRSLSKLVLEKTLSASSKPPNGVT